MVEDRRGLTISIQPSVSFPAANISNPPENDMSPILSLGWWSESKYKCWVDLIAYTVHREIQWEIFTGFGDSLRRIYLLAELYMSIIQTLSQIFRNKTGEVETILQREP